MKFILDNIFLIAIALISGGALLFPMLQRRGAKVSQLQATQYMNQGKTLVLDVRSPEEFATGHLPNAKNIPLADLNSRLKEIEKSKAGVVLAVCAKGVRSASAVSLLNKAGFAQAFSLDGGMDAWKTQGMPVIK
ncbi:rhodanese-like domain-containing protein [Undibacterium oligocarboniphilum]|uniref:Rhodanese-like domain-containing protein n=1 Tax=Undibacterium oligocarboniphilum TaxID=666702 RepID=A0A850QA46_9BURK|nr:rhodanese-like domain-containing protein [Undibacterium oligocarboniphilum]MBC3870946.1 rhodanese-like domain-containing protein [Undibacterium oligocarboniphilum]NVO76431.1 rhodanese-like domain-containing protein [Undibacterium oligocarboniphilum]